MGICLSYDNHQSEDGIGAQVFRIIDVFSLSRKYRVGFVNSEILHFDSNPGDNLKTPQAKIDFIDELRDFLNLDGFSCTRQHRIRSLNYSRAFKVPGALGIYLFVKQIINEFTSKHELFVVRNPYAYTYSKPEIRNFFRGTPRQYTTKSKPASVFQIHLHIRRAFSSSDKLSDRFVPTSWYLSVLRPVQHVLENHQVDYEFVLHTDVHSKNIKWSAIGVSKSSLDYLIQGGNSFDSDSIITLEYEDFSQSLSALNNLRIITELNPLDSWKLMQEADILVIAKSTFSFIGAILNNAALIMSPQGFLRGPKAWATIDESGLIPIDFQTRILEKVDKFIYLKKQQRGHH